MQATVNTTGWTVTLSNDAGFAEDLRIVDAEKLLKELERAVKDLRRDVDKALSSGTTLAPAPAGIEGDDTAKAPGFDEGLEIVRDRDEEDSDARKTAELLAQNKADAERQPSGDQPLYGPANTEERPEEAVDVDPAVDVDESMSRPELDAYLVHYGLDPSDYRNKGEAVKAIRKVQKAAAKA